MTPQFVVQLIHDALMAAFWMAAPLLVMSFALSIVINLIQIATSMQDPVFSSVPRLAACLGGFLLLMPWMLHHAAAYAVSVLRDFTQYAR